MPFIFVQILEGRTLDQRREFAREVTESAARNLQADPEKVRIQFVEFGPQDLARNGRLIIDESDKASPNGR